MKSKFEEELEKLKDVIAEHNANRKWWQPVWKLNENFLFYSICYDGFPNPFNLHRTMYGWSWTAFPKGYHALQKPEDARG